MKANRIYILRLFFLMVTFSFCFNMHAQKKIDPLLKSATDAYYSQKWKSAATLLDLYLRDSVNYSDAYKMAIIANFMGNDQESLNKGLNIIEKTQIPLGDILKSISSEMIRLRMFDDYEIIVHKLINKMPEQKLFLFNNLLSFRTLLHQPQDILRIIDEAVIYDIDPNAYIKKKADTYILLEIGRASCRERVASPV